MAKSFKLLLQENLDYISKIVATAETLREVCILLNYCDNGRNTGTLSSFLRANSIDYSHFRTSGAYIANLVEVECPLCNKVFQKNMNNSKDLKRVTCSHDCANKYFAWKQGAKNYKHGEAPSTYISKINKYYKSNNITPSCVVCNCTDILDVHHIDEDRSNNSIDNLVYLCPNHHSLLHRNKSDLVFNKIIEHLDYRDTLPLSKS
jgi:hypothetical protein